MKSGWLNDNHYNLFDSIEIENLTSKYELEKYIPNYKLIGLIGWDDFIIFKNNFYYKIPTVPIYEKYLEEIEMIDYLIELENEKENQNKIKWYTKPLIFGGDPCDPKNIKWINIEQHSQLVSYWNKIYFNIKK